MNRLDFLKKLMTGAAAVIVAPRLLANTEEPKKITEELKSAVPLPVVKEDKIDEFVDNGFSEEFEVFPEPEIDGYSDSIDDDVISPSSCSTSQPYILTIENKTSNAIENVQIFGSYDNRLKENYGNEKGIEINMGISGVSYAMMLAQTESKPFITGLTYLQSDNSKQILEGITYQQCDANGHRMTKPLTPILDPFQQESNTMALKHDYTVDGLSTLIIRKMFPNTTLNLYVYPTNKIASRRVFGGVARPTNNYDTPTKEIFLSKIAQEALIKTGLNP